MAVVVLWLRTFLTSLVELIGRYALCLETVSDGEYERIRGINETIDIDVEELL
jgi:hypothetical protein